jgi:hypothetical protein
MCTAIVVGYNWLLAGSASVKSCLVHVQPMAGQLGQTPILVVHLHEMCLQARLANFVVMLGCYGICVGLQRPNKLCVPPGAVYCWIVLG